MYAIVEIAGLQYKVSRKQRVYVNRLEAKEGDAVEFDKVLLIDNDGKITVGAPVIDGARVAAKVIAHLQGDKVIVFKKKRRKGYQKLNGHRQQLTELLIQGVLGKGDKLSAEDAKLEMVGIRELQERSRLKPTKKVFAETEEETEEEEAEVEEVEAVEETPAPKAKKSSKKKTEEKSEETTEE